MSSALQRRIWDSAKALSSASPTDATEASMPCSRRLSGADRIQDQGAPTTRAARAVCLGPLVRTADAVRAPGPAPAVVVHLAEPSPVRGPVAPVDRARPRLVLTDPARHAAGPRPCDAGARVLASSPCRSAGGHDRRRSGTCRRRRKRSVRSGGPWRSRRDTTATVAVASGIVHAAGWASRARTTPGRPPAVSPAGPAPYPEATSADDASSAVAHRTDPTTMPATAPRAVRPRHHTPSRITGDSADAAKTNTVPTLVTRPWGMVTSANASGMSVHATADQRNERTVPPNRSWLTTPASATTRPDDVPRNA